MRGAAAAVDAKADVPTTHASAAVMNSRLI
jgi:hypothetical protein